MKHIIFDLDGTLLDSMHLWKGIGAAYLKSQGVLPPAELSTILKKLTLPEAAEYFIKTFHLSYTVDEIVNTIIDMVAEQYRKEIPLKPYALEFLQKQKKEGSKMCILTASEPSYIHEALERLQLLPYFEFIMTCTDVGLTKNNPEVFRLAMQRLHGSLESTLVFEDALYAIESASHGGFYVVAVEDTVAAPDKPKILSLCNRYITSYQELL